MRARGSAVTKRTFEKSVGGGVVTRYLIAAKEILMPARDYGVDAARFLTASVVRDILLISDCQKLTG